MVAIAGDHAVVAGLKRRLDADRNRFLPDIQVAEATNQAQAIELARTLFKAADKHHLLIEMQQFLIACRVAFVGLMGGLQRIKRIGGVGMCSLRRIR